MSPKEKASELVEKFTAKYRIEFSEAIRGTDNPFIIDMQEGAVEFDINAKRIASKCVDEIIKEIEEAIKLTNGRRIGKSYRAKRWEFWQEVKQEIEKL